MNQRKVRVRACGLLIENNRLLLLRHEGLGPLGFLWSPPGGGMEFGIDAKTTVKKEFLEETNLEIEVGEFLFLNEHRDNKHHAVELFFEVTRLSGEPVLGEDPELKTQILSDIRFFSMPEVRQLSPESVHSILSRIESLKDVKELRGYYKFANSGN